ncbi:hypothetical protein ART_1260 [Arthrobacter sp. PAMC 25486]|uniref:CDP-glycerol glycerophosphotransferase family protein n=1 Tax=Arthrobacter sp. PAMC 25486 TaxID=1494608 RepID=UPI000535BF5C|nr:CDP-glycerol glycerophosphotransferase family protein [Arthrobacter sp. PAMC 25486]AIY00859.1 hypothetical protein ART_1260 [Arthrobacter sp. PAMC 25486]
MFGWKILYAAGRQCEKLNQFGLAESLYKCMLATTEKSNATVNYRLGHLYFSRKKYELAASYIGTAVSLKPSIPTWNYRLGFINERLNKYTEAEALYRAGIELSSDKSQWYYRLAKTQLAQNKNMDAIESLRLASDLDPNNRQFIDVLLSAINIKSAKWETLSYLLKMAEAPREDPYLQYRIARLYDDMHQLEAAAPFYKIANRNSDNAWWLYYEGYCLQRLSEEAKSAECFQKAILLDSQLMSQELGIGAFHQKIGNWPAARTAYEDRLSNTEATPNLLHSAGLSYDRTYDWDAAVEKYEQALLLKPDAANTHFRLAYCFEQTNNLDRAITAYKAAIAAAVSAPKHYHYRLAHCLERMGRFADAVEAHLLHAPDSASFTNQIRNLASEQPKATDPTANDSVQSWTDYLRDARDAALREDWREASRLIFNATMRRNDFNRALYYEAGYYHSLAGDHESACGFFRQTETYQSAGDMEHALSSKTHHLKAAKAYTAYRETLDIRNDFVLYESHMGASVDCNPLAIYNELQQDGSYSNLTHVWVISDIDIVPIEVKVNAKVILVEKNSDLYRRYLATCEYLINNVTFQNYFIRRSEQKYLNTWHGTPIKTLGKDINSGFLQHSNVARNFLQASHILTSNIHTAQTLVRQHDIDNIITAKVGYTGYPRTDITVNASKFKMDSIKKLLRIPVDSQLPIVLYAPTWRGDTNNQYFDTEKLCSDLAALNALNCHFIFRGHPLMEKALDGLNADYISAPKGIDSNSLLSIVDVLITDYSSIIFDFLPTGRPICLYAYDENDYKAERGLYLELDELPARVSRSIGELCRDVEVSFQGHNVPSNVYADAIKLYAQKDDGFAAKRAIDFFFGNNDEHLMGFGTDSRTSLLFRASLIPNGVTSSFLNLLSQLDPDRYIVSIVLDPAAFNSDADRLQKVNELPGHVRVLGRIGHKVFGPEEAWLDTTLTRCGNLTSPVQWNRYLAACSREYQRVFGRAEFDAVIEFDGYSLFWGSLLAGGSADGTKSLIYQHSDMKREWLTRAGYLTAIFNIYRYFDHIVSVSETIAKINRDNLADDFCIEGDSFVACNNQLDIPKILSQSSEPLDSDISTWIGDSERVFCTIGRLSVEKNHRKLIGAFVRELSVHQHSKLVVVGDGPLRSDLELLVKTLQMQESILIAGSRRNPFPVLKRSDLFLLSSDHEGQPMVLLEALVLDKAIISVDIPGAASILDGTSGVLVDNSIEGLATGMKNFSTNTPLDHGFDAQAYQQQALSSFESLVG